NPDLGVTTRDAGVVDPQVALALVATEQRASLEVVELTGGDAELELHEHGRAGYQVSRPAWVGSRAGGRRDPRPVAVRADLRPELRADTWARSAPCRGHRGCRAHRSAGTAPRLDLAALASAPGLRRCRSEIRWCPRRGRRGAGSRA